MQRALQQANKAAVSDEVPIGAVVVDVHGVVIARAHNQVEKKHTHSENADILALQTAGSKRKDWRLIGGWIYVTLEPCSMCMNLIQLSRCNGVVYGASSPLFGHRLDSNKEDQIYKKVTLSVVEGVCAGQSAQLLKNFFIQKRNEE